MADQVSPQGADDAAASTSTPVPEFPPKMRVHALAKTLRVTSKQVLAELQQMGRQITSAHASVDREIAEQIHAVLTGGTAAPETAAAPSPAPSAAQTPPAGVPQPLFLPPSATPVPAPEPAADDTAEPPAQKSADTADPGADQTDTDTDSDDEDGESPSGSRRRRRRGRRGRGRGRGDQTGEDGGEQSADKQADKATEKAAEKADAAAGKDTAGAGGESAEKTDGKPDGKSDGKADDKSEDSDDETSTGSSRRRRRRRRRRTDDADNGGGEQAETSPRERTGRSRRTGGDEVQGISGSTRLEAKRQRRRDGRDAGRRRPPILSESEFLARREAVDRVMVVREKADPHGGEPITQVGVLEDKILVEHFVASDATPSIVGNIYLGRVQNVLPSMEAAFVDIGRGRNGVLYAGEVDWAAAGLSGSSRKIEQALKPGDQVVVQVSKDPVGHKGARLTTQVSMAGRFLVYVPGGKSTGISRKLPDTERKRLKAILRQILPEDAGVIIRTAAEGVSEEELTRDIERLSTQWQELQQTAETEKKTKSTAPRPLYEEPDLLIKVVRDQFNEDFSELVIEGDDAWSTVSTYVERVAPELMERVTRFERETPEVDVFGAYRIDEQLAKALDRKVWLPSGGTLVIDRTEAMTVVDVNTGKFTGSGGNLEETVTRNNLEAAEEVVRQMRLRDIGGMIVVDFIDMVLESNRDLVLRRLTEALGRDRTRHQVSEVTSLGLVQMTRKRVGAGLVESFSTPCEHCHGRGLVVHADPIVSGGGSGQSGRSKGESRRSRRGRGGSGGENAQHKSEPTKAEKNPAEHPMFKAMAESNDDEPAADERNGKPAKTDAAPAKETARGDRRAEGRDREGGGEDRREGEETTAAAGQSAEDKADALAKIEAAVDRGTGRRRRRRATSKPATAPAAETGGKDSGDGPTRTEKSAGEERAVKTADKPAVDSAETAAPVERKVEPKAEVETEPKIEPKTEDRGAPRRRGPRRAVRTAAAPVAVTPAPAADEPVRSTVIVPDQQAAAEAAPPRRRPRRRAAGRQAGPPVE